MSDTTQLTVRLTPELRQKLADIRQQTGKTASQAIRDLIADANKSNLVLFHSATVAINTANIDAMTLRYNEDSPRPYSVWFLFNNGTEKTQHYESEDERDADFQTILAAR